MAAKSVTVYVCIIIHVIAQKCCQLLLSIAASSKDQLPVTGVASNTLAGSVSGRRMPQLQLIQCTDSNVLSYVISLFITCLQVCLI